MFQKIRGHHGVGFGFYINLRLIDIPVSVSCVQEGKCQNGCYAGMFEIARTGDSRI
jgi:hypothetical protein